MQQRIVADRVGRRGGAAGLVGIATGRPASAATVSQSLSFDSCLPPGQRDPERLFRPSQRRRTPRAEIEHGHPFVAPTGSTSWPAPPPSAVAPAPAPPRSTFRSAHPGPLPGPPNGPRSPTRRSPSSSRLPALVVVTKATATRGAGSINVSCDASPQTTHQHHHRRPVTTTTTTAAIARHRLHAAWPQTTTAPATTTITVTDHRRLVAGTWAARSPPPHRLAGIQRQGPRASQAATTVAPAARCSAPSPPAAARSSRPSSGATAPTARTARPPTPAPAAGPTAATPARAPS